MKFSFILILFSYFYCNSQKVEGYLSTDHDSIILRSNKKKLKWNDFKGKKIDSTFFAARAFTGITLLPYSKNSKTYSYKVFACFYKYKSIIDTKYSEYILEHEQLHFDIAEIFARKIRKEIYIQESKLLTVNYNLIYEKFYKLYRFYQQLYDMETYHSINFKMQEKWREKIKKELNELEEFSNPEY